MYLLQYHGLRRGLRLTNSLLILASNVPRRFGRGAWVELSELRQGGVKRYRNQCSRCSEGSQLQEGNRGNSNGYRVATRNSLTSVRRPSRSVSTVVSVRAARLWERLGRRCGSSFVISG